MLLGHDSLWADAEKNQIVNICSRVLGTLLFVMEGEVTTARLGTVNGLVSVIPPT